jgi:hypothetical protein
MRPSGLRALCSTVRMPKRAERALTPWRFATRQEVALVEALLSATGDARAAVLVRQFAESAIRRRRSRSSLTVEQSWTTEDLLVDMEQDRTSAWVATTTRAGVPVRVRLRVSRGGFLAPLEVDADTRLPRSLDVDTDALREAARGALHLGGPAELPGLSSWVHRWLGRLPANCPVTASHGGSAARAALERHGAPPADLLELVEHFDGLRVGDRRILRAEDMYVVDLDGETYWVIDVDAAEYTVVHGATGRVHSVSKEDARPRDVGVAIRDWFLAGCRPG